MKLTLVQMDRHLTRWVLCPQSNHDSKIAVATDLVALYLIFRFPEVSARRRLLKLEKKRPMCDLTFFEGDLASLF